MGKVKPLDASYAVEVPPSLHHLAYGSVPRRFGGLSLHRCTYGIHTQTTETGFLATTGPFIDGQIGEIVLTDRKGASQAGTMASDIAFVVI
jgi:hypothetical protein